MERLQAWRVRPGSLETAEILDANVRRNLIFIRDYLRSSRCADCGLDDLAALEFDHVRAVKIANVGLLAYSGRALRIVKDEIGKCRVLCANCHRRRTLKQRHGFLARAA